jgi:hypothetical protein
MEPESEQMEKSENRSADEKAEEKLEKIEREVERELAQADQRIELLMQAEPETPPQAVAVQKGLTKQAPQESDMAPSEKFWEDCEKRENDFGKPVEIPASPKNKKKNHARRERRLATRRRLADEKKK